MKWYAVQSLEGEEARIVGIILEADDGGIAGAVLEGSDHAPDSPYSVLKTLSEAPISVTLPSGSSRKVTTYGPRDDGFVEAMLYALRPPLCPGPRGTVSRVGPPREMLERVWGQVAGVTPIPLFVRL